MKDRDQRMDAHIKSIAKGFATVFISHQLPVSYNSAEKRIGDNVGDLWIYLAELAFKAVPEGLDEQHKNTNLESRQPDDF